MASYNVNYNDERFTKVENEKQAELDKTNKKYDDLINERNQFTNDQQNYIDKWEETQKQIANDNLKYQEELYNQKKEKAEQEYQKEAKASYIDYQKEVDRYGVSRENVVNNGLQNSGYAESSKVDMYNTYQNRVATARQGLNDAKLEFDNAIKEAQLQNNATLAENALKALEQKLNIALEGFNYKSEQENNRMNWNYNINNTYYNRYQDVEKQINYENEQAEAIRQFNEQMAYQREQQRLEQERWERELEYQRQQDAISNAQKWASINNSSTSTYSGSGGDGTELSDSSQPLTNSQSSGNNGSSRSMSQIAKSSGWTSTGLCMSYSNTKVSAKKYGTFDNGYQPKGINGYGKLSKSGHTCTINGQTQNIWLTKGDGKTRAWYWDGKTKTYVGISW